MWCPKCDKVVEGESRICRECGAILEELPDDTALAEDADRGSSDRNAGPDPTDPVMQDQSARRAEKPPVMAEPFFSPFDPDGADPVEGVEVNQPHEDSQDPWMCDRCGELVPGSFDVCWKCGTTDDGGLPAEKVAEVPGTSEEPRPDTSDYLRMLAAREKKNECVRCGSVRMMRGLTLCDQGQGSDGIAKIVVYGNPQALIFKNAFYGEILSDVCGNCGHVELRVNNPQDLYDHYLESLQNENS